MKILINQISNLASDLTIIALGLTVGALIVFNLSLYKLLLKKYRKLQLRYDLAIEGSKAGIYEWNIKENKITHNSMIDSMLGFDRDEFPDHSIEDFITRLHPEDANRVGLAVQDHLERRVPYDIEFRMKKKNGEYLWIADSGLALRNGAGKPILWVGTMINIQERKNAENCLKSQNQKLEEANKDMDLLLHRVSHDLRSPIAAILSIADLCKYSDSTLELKEYFALVEERALNLDSFIHEIVDYSRTIRSITHNEEINLLLLVKEIYSDLKLHIPGNFIELDLSVPDKFLVQTDKLILKGILANLIGNSIKYCDPVKSNKYVKVSSFDQGDFWQLEIDDNGLGIAPEFHGRIFDMFFRAASDSSGSGLGLYIVKESIKKLNGTIAMESTLGMGTTFRMKFNKMELNEERSYANNFVTN